MATGALRYVFMMIGFSITAFFSSLNLGTLLFFSGISLASYYYNKLYIATILKNEWINLKKLPVFIKYSILIFFISVLVKSSQLPSVIDNESYYIQTIKWLNEYGYVKGLANFHLFFAQTSPWHVLQAGLNFNFLYDRINDINGFIFIVCSLYFITESQLYYKRYKCLHWLGMIPVFSFIYFLFIDAPSPDLPLLLITPVILFLLTNHYNNIKNFKVAYLLFLFTAFIKITIAPVGILFIYYLSDKRKISYILKTTLPVIVIWMCKNTIISGYPLYPFTLVSGNFDWVVPINIFEGINIISNKYVYNTTSNSFLHKITSWIIQGGIKGFFNKLIVILFIIIPFFSKIRHSKIYLFTYFTFLIHFLLLLFMSPQYRFFLPTLLFFTAFIFAEIYNYYKLNHVFYTSPVFIGTLLACVGLIINPLKIMSGNYLIRNKISRACNPAPVTIYSTSTYNKNQLGNFFYYSPAGNYFIYATANGPLPCVNSKQIRYIRKKFRVVPQLRTNHIKDGFYSYKLPNTK